MDEDHKPTSAQQPQENDGYTIIVVNIPLFHVFNEMPIVLDPARLDNGGDIEEVDESVTQYQNCGLIFNKNINILVKYKATIVILCLHSC